MEVSGRVEMLEELRMDMFQIVEKLALIHPSLREQATDLAAAISLEHLKARCDEKNR